MKFEWKYKLKLDDPMTYRQADEWADEHDIVLLFGLSDDSVTFQTLEDLTMFKLKWGGDFVDDPL